LPVILPPSELWNCGTSEIEYWLAVFCDGTHKLYEVSDPEKILKKSHIGRAERFSCWHSYQPAEANQLLWKRRFWRRINFQCTAEPKFYSQTHERFMQLPYTIVAFSHLRWNFVYQRPQHLLSRLAAMHPVVFVEEPEFEEGPPHWDRSTPQPNVTVYRPRTPIRSPGFDGEQQAALEPLIAELSADLGNATLVAWLYTPMALPLALSLDPQAAVYDCMDELSLFLGAPPQLLTLESQLLEYADVMFTGGPSLFRAKQSRHPNVHCFPSSVDAEHFRLKDRQGKQVAESEEQSDIPHPRLGFYGVIDERLDLEIVERLSEAHPEWHIVLVGPVVKIDPDRLPRRPNIQYFGQR